MSRIAVNIYQAGETYERYEEFKDKDGEFATPGTHIKITIVDSAGTKKVDAQAMTEEATGKYYYRHDIPSDAENGHWYGWVEGSGTPGEARDYFQFEVRGGS